MTAIVTISAWSVFILRVQYLHHIKQRKVHRFTQASSADEDDKDDEYDSGFFYLSFPIRDAQNLRRIKQRKGLYLIQE